MNKTLLTLALSLLVSCATQKMPSDAEMVTMVEKALQQSHTIKRKWAVGDRTYYLVEGPDGISKLTLKRSQSETKNALMTTKTSRGVSFQVLYRVDPNIQSCFAGPSQSAIDCSKLKKDPDLAPFIKW